MNVVQNGQTGLQRPDQTLSNLSFCNTSIRAFGEWVDELPMANIGETAKRLYHAIQELNQLQDSAVERMPMLETIRPRIHYICKELSKHFLNQSIVLPDKQRKIASLAQALQLHLATGYLLVLDQASAAGDRLKKQITIALHRAITELSFCHLRAAQLYTPSPPGCWFEAHRLYGVSRSLELDERDVEDSTSSRRPNSTVEQTYKRLLLLGCAKTNQLRQPEIEAVFQCLEDWAVHTSLQAPPQNDALFIIDPESDAPPVYRGLLHTIPSTQMIGLDSTLLVQLLTERLTLQKDDAGVEKEQAASAGSRLSLPARVPDTVLANLSQALGIMTKRTFQRMAVQGNVTLAVGLTAIHYFCSAGTPFHRQIGKPNAARIIPPEEYLKRAVRPDAWGGSAPEPRNYAMDQRSADLSPISFDQGEPETDAESEVRYEQHLVPLINTSPGGYCIQWIGEVPSNVQAGELLAVREQENQSWSIAVIRWVRRIRQHGTQFGVELLAPSAQPCGVQLVQRTGSNTEYLRALMLPAIPALKQSISIITPRLPFQVGNRVNIMTEGEESKAMLERRLAATSSFSQFSLKALASVMDAPAYGKASSSNRNGSEDDFDILWPSL